MGTDLASSLLSSEQGADLESSKTGLEVSNIKPPFTQVRLAMQIVPIHTPLPAMNHSYCRDLWKRILHYFLPISFIC